jgi:Protein of unknown function (DUF2799)
MKYFFSLSILLLSSCSTFSKSDCESMNWQNEGYKAGSNGETAGQQAKFFQKECTVEHQVPVNIEKFSKGYEQGLKSYCSTSNLYQKGLNGDSYSGVCKKSEIAASYSNGRTQFLEKKVIEQEEAIQRLKSELDDLERKNSDLESKLNSCQ